VFKGQNKGVLAHVVLSVLKLRTLHHYGQLYLVLFHSSNSRYNEDLKSCNTKKDVNRIQAIRDSEVRATVFFTRKIHALNTLKMAPVLRSNVMQS
jgi:hypothetical protein